MLRKGPTRRVMRASLQVRAHVAPVAVGAPMRLCMSTSCCNFCFVNGGENALSHCICARMARPTPSSTVESTKYSHIWKRTLAFDKMVQTKAGSQNNPWLEHLRQCAAEYQRRRAAEHASSDEEQRAAATTGTTSEEKPVRRRVVGKKPEAKAIAPPKAEAKLLTEKDNKTLAKTVKEQGKRRAKKKDTEADNLQ